ncbi:unnamed protein product [Caenorhabditis auriculariae]|uniref:Uncharacterized protein n=1 Tax=Caenorhabditis auriculariae TaxID=2777116 RepID=A0A8S1HGV0_9PELO|nr:unnamed protein product [Caenorhabditis auriculariae]
MEIEDPYLPGSISLFEQLDKKLMINKFYCETNQGFLLIRGENVELAGEIDENVQTGLKKVSTEELQRIEEEINTDSPREDIVKKIVESEG